MKIDSKLLRHSYTGVSYFFLLVILYYHTPAIQLITNTSYSMRNQLCRHMVQLFAESKLAVENQIFNLLICEPFIPLYIIYLCHLFDSGNVQPFFFFFTLDSTETRSTSLSLRVYQYSVQLVRQVKDTIHNMCNLYVFPLCSIRKYLVWPFR